MAAPSTADCALNVPTAAAIVTVPALVAPTLILVSVQCSYDVTLVALPLKIMHILLTFLFQNTS